MKTVQIDKIYKILSREAPKWDTPVAELMQMQTRDPFKVLITTILSARTNDKTTGSAARRLFEHVKNINDLEKIKLSKLERLIYPVGFYKTKAKHLKELPGVLNNEFNRKIPSRVEELIKLPGVGRKTANLVVSVSFNKHAICVDTHVHRIMNRLGYVKTKNPMQTEFALRDKLPKKYWKKINSLLVALGQNICKPITPRCSQCPIYGYCNRIGVIKSK